MSSDIYIYVYNNKDIDLKDCTDAIRLGDTGVCTYFGFNLAREVNKIMWPDRQVTNDFINQFKIIVGRLNDIKVKASSLSREDFINAYGYDGPHGIEWDDMIQESEVEEEFTPYLGKFIIIGYD